MPRDVYTHGHHESVLRSHQWRTVENSAGYLRPRLRPGAKVLDVGSGPGTITVGIAELVAPGGRVVGLEPVPEPHLAARRAAERAGVTNVSWELGSVYRLTYHDDTFDVVHAHQVLQHLSDPIAALREMARVCRADGVVAARDADYSAMTWFPEHSGLDDWLDLYHQIARGNHAEPDAGRRLLSWARAAGLRAVEASASTWCYATREACSWWGELWADRVTKSSFAEQALSRGLASAADLERLAAAWRNWAAQEDGWFAVLNGEILAEP
ncbi:MAG: methyltransferase domain-containing protein [Candidatus Dormibacteraceae bacterium]